MHQSDEEQRLQVFALTPVDSTEISIVDILPVIGSTQHSHTFRNRVTHYFGVEWKRIFIDDYGLTPRILVSVTSVDDSGTVTIRLVSAFLPVHARRRGFLTYVCKQCVAHYQNRGCSVIMRSTYQITPDLEAFYQYNNFVLHDNIYERVWGSRECSSTF
jgi:hypothetical protein